MRKQENKEFVFAQSVENEINSFGFDVKEFAESIRSFHPTLQQKFYRIIKECIFVLADSGRPIDDRNIASHKECQKIAEFLKREGRNIPTI